MNKPGLGIEEEFLYELQKFEEELSMPYVTSIERIGIKKGIEQGIEQGALTEAYELIVDVLDVRFGNVPEEVTKTLKNIKVLETLKTLHRHAAICETLDHFRVKLNELSE